MGQTVEIEVREIPDVVLAFDGDAAGERAIWRMIDKVAPKPSPLRSQATWEVDAEREHWARMAVECDGAGAFFVMCRERVRECEAELDRRRRLAYQAAESPYDWPKILAAIKASSDLIAVICSRRPDCMAGKGIRTTGHRIVLRCPFHVESTGSFVVYLDDQHYYCFGCRAGGDVLDAVQTLDGLTFVQAAEALANEFGIELPKPAPRGARPREID